MIFAITIISVLAFALTNIFAKKTWQTFLSVCLLYTSPSPRD